MKTPVDFYKQYNGKNIDIDGASGTQCVDGFKVFCRWMGIPIKACPNGWAESYWTCKNKAGKIVRSTKEWQTDHFYLIHKPSEFQNGDWVIWLSGSKSHPKSHISMWLDGKEFGESGSAPRGFVKKRTDFSDAAGALRWKGWAYNPVFRMYNPNSGFHYFTIKSSERDILRNKGWKYEGVGWNASQFGSAVYVLYCHHTGDHIFTRLPDRRNSLKGDGWDYQGIAFYTTDDGIPVYELYNRYNKEHFYTANEGEVNALVKLGWQNNGTAFYGQKG